MSPLARVCSLSVLLALWIGAACADEADLSLGGFICVRPFAPACVDGPAAYTTKADVANCQSEVDRFVAATVAYRDCLQRQIGGAVRRVNDVVDRFRCLSQHDSCPPSAKSSANGAKPPARAN